MDGWTDLELPVLLQIISYRVRGWTLLSTFFFTGG